MEVYTPEEVAEILKVNADTIRRYLREEKIKGFKIGNSWRVRAEELENFMKDDQQ